MEAKLIATLLATAASSLIAAGAAHGQHTTHYQWSKMTLSQRIHVQHRLVVQDWKVITTKEAPYPVIEWHWRHMKWTKRELKESLREQARVAVAKVSMYPPHHSLWMCISRYEGGPTSVNPNGHYGMLQMTYNWMKQIHGRASDYSQAVQEWAAERAWAANSYSYSFLYGQWFAYDNADGCYSG